jgi:hypothetical protein
MRSILKPRSFRSSALAVTGVAVLSSLATGCSQTTVAFPVPGGDAAALYPQIEQCASSNRLTVTHKRDPDSLLVVLEDNTQVTYEAAGASLRVGVRIEGFMPDGMMREQRNRALARAGRIYRCAARTPGG